MGQGREICCESNRAADDEADQAAKAEAKRTEGRHDHEWQ
jgi:hypothetical protein